MPSRATSLYADDQKARVILLIKCGLSTWVIHEAERVHIQTIQQIWRLLALPKVPKITGRPHKVTAEIEEVHEVVMEMVEVVAFDEDL